LVIVGPGEVKNIPVIVLSDPDKVENSTNEIIFNVQSVSDKKIFAEAESKFLAIAHY
jgi:hypothetical protein